MKNSIDGKALVYCEGAFNTPNGKTAHGLVRFTERYEVVGVIDSKYAEHDAGETLDGKNNGIPIFRDLDTAVEKLKSTDDRTQFFGYRPCSRWGPVAERSQIRNKKGLTNGVERR